MLYIVFSIFVSYTLMTYYRCLFQMSGVKHFFLNDFAPAHKNDDFVDLTDLVEYFKNFTPIPLKCTKPEEAIQYVLKSLVIVLTFTV